MISKKVLTLILCLLSFSAFSQSSITMGDLMVADANRQWHYYMEKSEELLVKIEIQAKKTKDSEYFNDLEDAFEALLPLNTKNFISLTTVKACYKKASRKYNKAVRKHNKRIKNN